MAHRIPLPPKVTPHSGSTELLDIDTPVMVIAPNPGEHLHIEYVSIANISDSEVIVELEAGALVRTYVVGKKSTHSQTFGKIGMILAPDTGMVVRSLSKIKKGSVIIQTGGWGHSDTEERLW